MTFMITKCVLSFCLLCCPLWAIKNPHPRLVGAAAPGIGASDGSTVGSWRWKAAHHKSDWGMFCAYLDDWYARGAQFGARYRLGRPCATIEPVGCAHAFEMALEMSVNDEPIAERQIQGHCHPGPMEALFPHQRGPVVPSPG